MERAKTDLAERLFKYLSDHLDPTVKAGISSTQMREILHGVVDWIDASPQLQKYIVSKLAEKPPQAHAPPKIEETRVEDFLEDLSKL